MKTCIYPFGLIVCLAMATATQRHPRLPESGQATSQPDPFDIAFQTLDGYVDRDMAYEDLSGVPRMPDQADLKRTVGTTVSLKELQHKVPGSALKESHKGIKAFRKADYPTAREHFQKAVEIDPEFADARNDLGVALTKLGRLQESADELRKAVEILPGHNQAAANLSLVLLRLKQYQEASQMARLALKINPGNLQLCYVLGLALFVENGDNTEALYNLRRAADQFPRARLIISEILIDTGQPSEAVTELEEYLHRAPEADPARSQIEARLAQLGH